ncbi:MAG: Gx transporter family protein [Ruminococcaceae bacterium]|nr:Gx transporter family protein [Oscillospiraceae bacterium]
MQFRDSLRKLTATAVLTAVALIVFVVEAQIPPIVPLPGIKLGLANAITLIAMELLGKRYAAGLVLLRIVLSAVLTGTLMSFLYSLCGGVLSLAVMCMVHKLLGSSKLWAISVLGAIAHNAGQLLVAMRLLGFGAVIGYLPTLTISAIICGAGVGLCAQAVSARLKNMKII